MRTSHPIAALFLAILLVSTPAAAARSASAKHRNGTQGQRLAVHENLPRDPLIVLAVWLENPGDEIGGLLRAVGRFAPRTFGVAEAASLVSLDEEQIDTLHNDLLPSIGPELALAVDLPPIDEAVSALHFSQDGALEVFLGRIGILGRVRDSKGLDRALRRMILASGGEIVEAEHLTRASLPMGIVAADGTGSTSPTLQVFYALRGERWAFGFSADWVRESLEPRPKGQRLTDGEDFKAVFARLDSRPTDLTYVNLPKLRQYVTGSQVVQAVLRSNAEFRGFVNQFFTGETMNVGMGSTSVRMEDGVRTTHFGPQWMSGTAVTSGFAAALALPNLMAAIDRGKTRQTLTDIRAIAQACERFSTDSRNYPGPTDGWVPVERIAALLEPVYIGQLPRTDGWENPILYWSNGGSYRILSMGRDGRIDRDWTHQVAPAVSAGQDADIVFGDGQPLAWPSGMEPE